MKYKTAKNNEDLKLFFPVLKELRPHLSFEEYLSIYQEAHARDQYEMVALVENEKILALMGYRVLCDFVRGRHLYIDDLVSVEKSKGHGAQLLSYAEEKARELECTGGLRLCAVLENTGGIKFYEKNGWKARAFAFVKKPL
ncbi:GNAT family N-acetyltransferase [Bacteriovorax stolpii]|uniref:GNAT family N-acetyltransferase n=1 Tax=Bacteriovorax stolpii TaxID=960 RepID=A0A2K9NPM2_BACTC|nr:GNAT family N-acetyltransferase [Bacteriovorax stolpii]AUN97470.1 GNAT family N-acetyltransferase [Bacteriovorax stolpii]TDP52647.1 acetyltransferase (GNAT) family protein [Bacteriovorax stolpii]